MPKITNDDDNTIAGGKRKRATRKSINYSDLATPITELELDEYLDLDDMEDGVEDDDVPDGDTVYGSRKITTKSKKASARKRPRLTISRPRKPEKPFPFLSLPAELRDYIYELALVEPEGVTVISKFKAFRRIAARGPMYGEDVSWYRNRPRCYNRDIEPLPQSAQLTPNLLAVNKQIRAEGIGYLYQQPIILEDTMALHTFVAAIGPINRLQLKDLVVRGWGCGRGTHKAMNFAALTLLAGCTNLKSLHIDCSIGWHRMPKHLARQIFRDGHYFFEAYGAANGCRDAALSVLKLGDDNFNNTRYHRLNVPDLEEDEYKSQFDIEMRKLLGC